MTQERPPLSRRAAVERLKDLQSGLFRMHITGQPLRAEQRRTMEKAFVSELVNVAVAALEYDELIERDFASSEECLAETQRIAKHNREALNALARAVEGRTQ